VSNQTYFYKLKTSEHIVMDDITQAKNYSLGIVRGDIYEMLVRRLGFVADKNGYTDLMVDGAPLPHQPDTIIRWLIDRLRS
jgi:polar amino acid transport system substrate-binding protein